MTDLPTLITRLEAGEMGQEMCARIACLHFTREFEEGDGL